MVCSHRTAGNVHVQGRSGHCVMLCTAYCQQHFMVLCGRILRWRRKFYRQHCVLAEQF